MATQVIQGVIKKPLASPAPVASPVKSPSLADQLSVYAANKDAGYSAMAKQGDIYNTQKAAGDMTGANDAHTLANQIRDAMGVSADYNRTNGALLKPKGDVTISGNGGTDTGGQTNQGYAPQNNNSDLIAKLYDSMYASQSQKLKSINDQKLAGLAGQDDLIKQQGAADLNANDVSGARLANQLREHMANLGLLQGGDYISQQVAQDTGQQQNANDINMNMSNKLQQLLAQKDAINNNSAADDLSLLQGLQSQSALAQLNQSNTDRSFGLQEAGLTGSLNGKDTLAKSNADRGYGLDIAGLSGNLPGGGQTLQAKQIQSNEEQRGLDNQYRTDQFNMQKTQQDWQNSFAQGQFDYQKASDSWERNFKDKSFDQSVKQAAQQLGLDYSKMNQQQQQFAAEQAFRERSFKAEQEQQSINNVFRQEESGFQKDLEVFKATGQAPASLSKYGIDVQGLNDATIKQDLVAMYGAFANKTLTPEDAIKMIDDKVKIGAEDATNGQKMKAAIYKLYPDADPNKPKKPVIGIGSRTGEELNSSMKELAGGLPGAQGFANWWSGIAKNIF